MTSEVDLAIERILSDRNTTSSSTGADVDSDVTNTSEEGLLMGQSLTTVFGKSVAIHSPATKMDSEPILEYKDATSAPPQIEEAGKRSGGGGGGSDGERDLKEQATALAKSVFDNLIDDAILGLVFEAHRAAKTGLFFLYDSTDAEDDDDLRIEQQYGVDIFGQALISTSKTSKALAQLECVCPQCHQSRLACRFAPHLEKCMGMGRNSSRLASRRLAASAAAATNAANAAANRRTDSNAVFNGGDSSDDGEADDDPLGNDDDDDDDDWTSGGGGGGGAFGKKRSQRKRGAGVNSSRTPKKRGGNVRISPKKPAGLRSAGGSGSMIGDLLLNETPSKGDGARKIRKTNSYGKFPVTSATQQSPDFEMDLAVNEFLSLGDSYDPPSPSF